MTSGEPVSRIFFSLPPAKKPTLRLSGDQKGVCPSSVPGSGVFDPDVRSRIQSCEPVRERAGKTRSRPSGETAKLPEFWVKPNTAPGGGVTARLQEPISMGGFERCH